MKRLAVLLALTLLGSCDFSYEKTEQWDRAVWSEDASQQAYIALRFEEKGSNNPLDGTTLKRNFSHQIYIQNPDGSGRQAVGNEFSGQNAFDFYFQKQAGYLIASYIDTSAAQPEPRYYRLKLDGTVTRLTDKPDERIIPSPDGQYLARITEYPSTCANQAGNCPVDVVLLKGDTLAQVGKKYQLALKSAAGYPQTTWNPAGQLIVSDGTQALAITPGQDDTAAVPQPGCFEPPTRSASVNADRLLVYPEGAQLKTRPLEAADAQQPFGCQ